MLIKHRHRTCKIRSAYKIMMSVALECVSLETSSAGFNGGVDEIGMVSMKSVYCMECFGTSRLSGMLFLYFSSYERRDFFWPA